MHCKNCAEQVVWDDTMDCWVHDVGGYITCDSPSHQVAELSDEDALEDALRHGPERRHYGELLKEAGRS